MLILYIIFLSIIKKAAGSISYNQPKLCPSTTWNPDAITLSLGNTSLIEPSAIYVTLNNAIYLVDTQKNEVLFWINDGGSPTSIVWNGLSYPKAVFVDSDEDIYVDNGNVEGRVEKRLSNTNVSVAVMSVTSSCYGLFIDINDTLYCSMHERHRVVKRWLFSESNATITIAGIGVDDSASDALSYPCGIFVDTNFDLYVADYRNDRIQLFQPGELNGTTVVGVASSPATISLRQPTGVVFDADGYLYIVEYGNNHIIGSGPTGFRCIVGCSDSPGSSSNELSTPWSLSFDNLGNIFVTDWGNKRIQKFLLSTNSCNITTTTAPTTTQMPQEGISYNQPKLCSSATWNPDAITLPGSDASNSIFTSIFVNSNDSVYLIDSQNTAALLWLKDDVNPTNIISIGLQSSYSIFVTINGDIYVDDGGGSSAVFKWTPTTKTLTPVMSVTASCYGLFVDTNDALYCSMYNNHEVVKRWLCSNATTVTTVAGTGAPSSTPDKLSNPHGIFVDINFDLYVADSANDRIQLFRLGQLNGATVAGSTSPNTTIVLNGPSGVVLDADKYLFIVDSGNNRIVGSGPNGFRCVAACSGSLGSTSSELRDPWSLSFDSHGNIFVADSGNDRIQKFLVLNNSCDDTTTTEIQTATISYATEVETTTAPTTINIQITVAPELVRCG